MTENRLMDHVHLTAGFYEDGTVNVVLTIESLDGLVSESVGRQYRAGTQDAEVMGDICRLLTGFGAWGLMGLEEARQQLPTCVSA